MANTGYIINPYIKQVFTSGPSSGSLVSSSYVINFDPSSSFTDAVLCGTIYEYRKFDPINCPITGFCISPTILTASVINCSDLNYNYLITYDINGITSSISSSVIEYSLNPSFNPYFSTTFNNTTDYINSSSLSLNGNTPLNKKQPIYLRLKNECSGSGSSLYSNTIIAQCPPIDTVVTTQNGSTAAHCTARTFLIEGTPNEVIRFKFNNFNPGISGLNITIKEFGTQAILYSVDRYDTTPLPDLLVPLNPNGSKRFTYVFCVKQPFPTVPNAVSIDINIIEPYNNIIVKTYNLSVS